MKILNGATFIGLLLLITSKVASQGLKIYNYGIGYRVFEMKAVGNNPTTIAGLLKDGYSYQQFLNGFNYNNLTGNPGIQQLQTLYATAEWKAENPQSRFWKTHTLQTGILLTVPLKERAGAIGYQTYSFSPDTAIYLNEYSLHKKIQLAGLQLGLNRRFNLAKRWQLFGALHVQGSVAIVHHYKQQTDSSKFTRRGGWQTVTKPMPQLAGKNFFQWQALVPLGVEYAIRKNLIFVRLELNLGVVGSRYRNKSFAAREAHGFGMAILYQPKTR